ncbi:HER027Wp [Eremothecium sinecaudum]|uniref:HER027Wp n=1 Tax=Eremothecium sinecaudum TaxID=45286 RepID=A0A0X8HTR8_9SACH|nr:HER027Wp [Eremothecium sinecaudum]AMD21306.1 HER027Wp [Eremothecium sinecaudum]
MTDLIAKFESLAITPSTPNKEQLAYETQWSTVLKTGKVPDKLDELNLMLRDNLFVTATPEPVRTDVELFEAVLPVLKGISASSKDVKGNYAKYRHIYRWADYLQKLLQLPENERVYVPYEMDLPREVIEKKKKEASTTCDGKDKVQPASAAGAAGEKSAKQPRGKPDEATLAKLREEAKAKKAAKKAAAANQPTQQAEAAAKLVPSLVDFRVGFIQKAIKHPDADSLYVSTIDVGEAEGPRTVCSGLVKHYPLEAMQERYVVLVCNLKPVNMRGIKSTAMVLCGSAGDKVEFVSPPAGSKPGDKVFFEGFGNDEPAKQLNPKKKIWEQLQPHFTTNDKCEVIFKDDEDKEKTIRLLTNAKGESFKVDTVVNAEVR